MSARRLGWLIARARRAYYVAVLPIYGVGVALVVGVVLDLYQAMVAIVISPDKRGRWDLYHTAAELAVGMVRGSRGRCRCVVDP